MQREAGVAGAVAREAVTMHAGGRSVAVRSLDDLEALLASRVNVTATDVEAWRGLDDAALVEEMRRSHAAESALRAALAQSADRPERLAELLAAMDPELPGLEHDWGDILTALAGHHDGPPSWLRLAVGKCRDYLLVRKQTLYDLYRARQPGAGEDGSGDGASGTGRGQGPEQGPAPGRGASDAFGQTRFAPGDSADQLARDAEARRSGLVRLPRGREVRFGLERQSGTALRLASHPFEVVVRDRPYLVDDGGEEWPLRDGRNLIGRALHNDIVIRSDYTDVSRSHAVLEMRGGGLHAITDVSSRGTFVPRTAIER